MLNAPIQSSKQGITQCFPHRLNFGEKLVLLKPAEVSPVQPRLEKRQENFKKLTF